MLAPMKHGMNVVAGLAVLAAGAVTLNVAHAESIKIGTIRSTNAGSLHIAVEKGYFAAEGLTAELDYFQSAESIAVATVANALDFGVTGATGGFYALAGQGQLRIIAGSVHEAPGFHFQAFLASAPAFAAGLKSAKDLQGHSVALTQVGNPAHYVLGLTAEKYGFDLKSMRILPVQSIPNAVSALVGGQADATVLSLSGSIPPLVRSGQIKLIGWVGDETPWQMGLAFTATKTANDKRDLVERFLRAYRKGARAYHDAFTAADGTRRDGPAAPETVRIVAKYTALSEDEVRLDIPYIDADARLDVKDVVHQIAWYKSQGMVKGEVEADAIIDKRYVIPLPAQ